MEWKKTKDSVWYLKIAEVHWPYMKSQEGGNGIQVKVFLVADCKGEIIPSW